MAWVAVVLMLLPNGMKMYQYLSPFATEGACTQYVQTLPNIMEGIVEVTHVECIKIKKEFYSSGALP